MDLRYLLEVDDFGTPTIKKFDSAIDKSAANTKKASNKIGKSFKAIGKAGKKAALVFGAIGVAAVALAGIALFKLGKSAVKVATDFTEIEQKFGEVFKSVQNQADKTADNLAKNFGLSNKAARELLSGTGDLLTGFGFTDKAALSMSQRVNELAVDLASFTNLQGGAERASVALTRGLLGEREMLKTLGISILESDVQTRLLAEGLDKLTGVALKAAKAQVTFDLILQQSEKALDDFKRTSTSLANQQRILNARFEDLQVTLGKKLTPIVNIFVGAAIKVVNGLEKWIKTNDKLINSGIVKFAKLFANAVFFLGDAVLFVIKKFNFMLAGLQFLDAQFLSLKITILEFSKSVLIAFSQIGKSIVKFFQEPVDAIKRQFINFSLFINGLIQDAVSFGSAILPQSVVDNVNKNVATLKKELASMGKSTADGTNAVSTAFDTMAFAIDEGIKVSKKQIIENAKASLSFIILGLSSDKFKKKLSSLNDEVIKNINLTSKTPDKIVAAKSANIPSTDPKFIQQRLAAERAAAAEAAKIELARQAKILESAKEVSAFLITENQLRFAEIEANAAKQIAAANFLQNEGLLPGIIEHENLKTEIAVQAELQRNAVLNDIRQVEFDLAQSHREAEIDGLMSHEQALFDASAGGLFQRNAMVQKAQADRMKLISKQVAAEKTLEGQKNKALLLTTAQLGGALLGLAQQQGGKLFAIAKGIAIAEATVNTIRGAMSAFGSVPYPANIVAMASALVTGFAQVAAISSTSVGGGGGGGGAIPSGGGVSGGGGGFGSAPGLDSFTTPVLTDLAENPQQIVINITGSFIGNEAELASKIAEIIEDATADDVDFGLSVRGS